MARTLKAVYEDGVFKPLEDPGLPNHERVIIEIKERAGERPERLKQRTFGSAKGLVRMSEDFDEPLELVTSKELETLRAPIKTSS